jgi:hypothetical protein
MSGGGSVWRAVAGRLRIVAGAGTGIEDGIRGAHSGQ